MVVSVVPPPGWDTTEVSTPRLSTSCLVLQMVGDGKESHMGSWIRLRFSLLHPVNDGPEKRGQPAEIERRLYGAAATVPVKRTGLTI